MRPQSSTLPAVVKRFLIIFHFFLFFFPFHSLPYHLARAHSMRARAREFRFSENHAENVLSFLFSVGIQQKTNLFILQKKMPSEHLISLTSNFCYPFRLIPPRFTAHFYPEMSRFQPHFEPKVQFAASEICIHRELELLHKYLLESRNIILLIENKHGFLVIDRLHTAERQRAISMCNQHRIGADAGHTLIAIHKSLDIRKQHQQSLYSAYSSSILQPAVRTVVIPPRTSFPTVRYLPAVVLQVWDSASSRLFADFHRSTHIASVVPKKEPARRRAWINAFETDVAWPGKRFASQILS